MPEPVWEGRLHPADHSSNYRGRDSKVSFMASRHVKFLQRFLYEKLTT